MIILLSYYYLFKGIHFIYLTYSVVDICYCIQIKKNTLKLNLLTQIGVNENTL